MSDDQQAAAVQRVLGYARRVAVVGLSDSPARESYGVARALQVRGYEVIPVNPNIDEALGERAYPSLRDVPGPIDLVDVFRREEFLVGVAEDAVAVDARALWLQSGLASRGAREIAAAAGLDYVEDRCLMVEVARYRDIMQLPPQVA